MLQEKIQAIKSHVECLIDTGAAREVLVDWFIRDVAGTGDNEISDILKGNVTKDEVKSLIDEMIKAGEILVSNDFRGGPGGFLYAARFGHTGESVKAIEESMGGVTYEDFSNDMEKLGKETGFTWHG